MLRQRKAKDWSGFCLALTFRTQALNCLLSDVSGFRVFNIRIPTNMLVPQKFDQKSKDFLLTGLNLGFAYLDILDGEFVPLQDLLELFHVQGFDGSGLLPERQALITKNLK